MNKLFSLLYQYKYLTATLATICLYLQQQINHYQQNYYLFFIFFSTLFIYSLDKYKQQKNKKIKKILKLQIIISFITITIIIIYYPIALWKFSIIFLLCLSYIFPIIKNQPFIAYLNIKTFFVPIIWLIVLNIPYPKFNLENILYNLSLLILLFFNMLACDTIDTQEDKKRKIKSLSQLSTTKQIYIQLLVLTISLFIFIINIITIYNQTIIIITFTSLYIFYLIKTKNYCKQKNRISHNTSYYNCSHFYLKTKCYEKKELHY